MKKSIAAIKSINSGDATKAKDILEEGKKSFNKRLKLIRIADMEDLATVQEYLSDDLASDTEDEKHINRAIKTTNSKKENTCPQKSASQSVFPYRRNQQYKSLTKCVLQTSNFRPQTFTNDRVFRSCVRRGHTQYRCPSNQYRHIFTDNTDKKQIVLI